ncbi:MAG: GIY-YIG nuclease family protein [Pseudolabrys sp.]
MRRVSEHKGKRVAGFTGQYGVTRLVYFEEFSSILDARARERSMKRWHRAWKIELLKKTIPDWVDLADQIMM